jgi:hypothetical protein
MYLSHSQKTRRNAERIQANGHKIQPDKTVNAWKVPATSEYPAPHGRPDYMWMGTGSDRAGLGHLQQPSRVRKFANAGIPASEQREKLPVLAEAHTTVGRHVGYSGRDRPVMATYIKRQSRAGGCDHLGETVLCRMYPDQVGEGGVTHPQDVTEEMDVEGQIMEGNTLHTRSLVCG